LDEYGTYHPIHENLKRIEYFLSISKKEKYYKKIQDDVKGKYHGYAPIVRTVICP